MLKANPEPSALADLKSSQGTFLRIRGESAAGLVLLEDALAMLPVQDRIGRAILLMETGLGYYAVGRLEVSENYFRESHQISLAENQLFAGIYMMLFLGHVQMVRGKFDDAQATCQQGLDIAESDGSHTTFLTAGAVHAGMAALQFELGDLETAVFHVQQAITCGEQGAPFDATLLGSLAMARIEASNHQFEDALASIKNAEQIVQRTQTPHWVRGVAACEIRILLEYQEFAKESDFSSRIDQWLNKTPLHEGCGSSIATLIVPGFAHDLEPLTYVRVLLARQQTDLAEAELLRLKTAAEKSGRVISLNEIAKLTALIASPTPSKTSSPLDELSKREIEMLKLVADGLSNREIAEQLVLAVGTVKRHTNNIYSKLHVRNRMEAVVAARERGDLE